jgi:hypothetical protein
MTLATQPAPPTSSSTPRLSEIARHLVLPESIVTTGFPAVRQTCLQLKIVFDPWQEGAGSAILGKRADGLYAADAIVLSIPRQVGKTFLIGAIIFALCLNTPDSLVLWTAHRSPTANETYQSMKAMCQRPELAAHIESASAPAGNGVIKFHNGSRILFGAREQGFGRGFAKVAIIVFDEAQILTQNALDDMIPATNQATNPLIIYVGTPPKPTDPGEVFTNLRREALAGESTDTLYIEIAADPDADPTDREQWRKMNPSYPLRTSARAILRMKKNLSPESFRREAMGIWDELAKSYAFGAGKWESCALESDPAPHPATLALSVSMDRKWASIGGSAMVEIDEKPRLMGAAVDRREGTGWLVPEAKRLHETYGCRIAVTRSASDLIPAFEAVGLMVGGALEVVRAGDAQDACAVIYDRVQDGTFAHANHDDLDLSVYGAHRRNVADRWVWDRKNSETDVSMLEAVTAATWLAALAEPDYDVLDSIG